MPDPVLIPAGSDRDARRTAWLLPLTAFVVAIIGRVAVLVAAPTPFAFDAFQRWAGREHLLVRDWLPATQAVVVATAALGGDHYGARAALAVVAALGVAAGAVVARRLGGPRAGWLFVPVGLFGPYLCWSTALYQEGTFLAVLLGGLALALRARAGESGWLGADLLVGLLGLVRYEGWPVVLLYLLWRRSPRALAASWGALVWLSIRTLGVEGHAPSPVDYADWGGLAGRFDAAVYLASLDKLLSQSWQSGGLAVAALGVGGAGLLLHRRRDGAGLLCLTLLAQLAAVAGWLVGLETAIVRMQVVPVVLLGLLAAAGLGPWLSTRARLIGAAVLVCVAGGLWLQDGLRLAQRAEAGLRWERELVAAVEAEQPDTMWLLTPRLGLGTRDRHDGCEIVEGMTDWSHGRDFHCETWPGERPEGASLQATWAPGGYRLRVLPRSERGGR